MDNGVLIPVVFRQVQLQLQVLVHFITFEINYIFLCLGRCPLKDNALPTIPNSYRSNVDNIKVYSDGFAEGYYDIDCNAGYALDSTSNERITCLPSGSWSEPLPQCKCRLFLF